VLTISAIRGCAICRMRCRQAGGRCGAAPFCATSRIAIVTAWQRGGRIRRRVRRPIADFEWRRGPSLDGDHRWCRCPPSDRSGPDRGSNPTKLKRRTQERHVHHPTRHNGGEPKIQTQRCTPNVRAVNTRGNHSARLNGIAAPSSNGIDVPK